MKNDTVYNLSIVLIVTVVAVVGIFTSFNNASGQNYYPNLDFDVVGQAIFQSPQSPQWYNIQSPHLVNEWVFMRNVHAFDKTSGLDVSLDNSWVYIHDIYYDSNAWLFNFPNTKWLYIHPSSRFSLTGYNLRTESWHYYTIYGVGEAYMFMNENFLNKPVGDMFHSADYNFDGMIDSSETNRVLAYWRAGSYHIDSNGLDGYAPGFGNREGATHDADLNGDWVISDSELATFMNLTVLEGCYKIYYDNGWHCDLNYKFHPADTNRDFRITASEVTAYGSGAHSDSAALIWKYGELYGWNMFSNTWEPVHPADTNRDFRITASEVTAYGSGAHSDSAALIWKYGELYGWNMFSNTWEPVS